MYVMRYPHFVNYLFKFDSVTPPLIHLFVFAYLNLRLYIQIEITKRLHKDSVAIC